MNLLLVIIINNVAISLHYSCRRSRELGLDLVEMRVNPNQPPGISSTSYLLSSIVQFLIINSDLFHFLLLLFHRLSFDELS